VKSLFNYFSGAVDELKKVSFPTKQETKQATWAVSIIIVALAVYLLVVDFIFSKLVRLFIP
jgi:preprotein translocase subunit SecE